MQSKSIAALKPFNDAHFHESFLSGSDRPFWLSAFHHDPDCMIWVNVFFGKFILKTFME